MEYLDANETTVSNYTVVHFHTSMFVYFYYLEHLFVYTWLVTAQGGEKILNVNFIIIVKTKTNDNWQQPRIIV